jgi:hypothetical protein
MLLGWKVYLEVSGNIWNVGPFTWVDESEDGVYSMESH